MNDIKDYILDGTPTDVIERYMRLPGIAEDADFGILDRDVVVLDTETTGLSYNHDELIQIAAARIEGGKVVDWFVTFVNPGIPIPEEIVHLTNIKDSDVEGAPGPSEALEALVQFAGNAKIVAHNAEFDKTFVTNHPAGYPLLENRWIDSLQLSRIALPRMKSHRLIDLVRAFGAPISTHRADDDVTATCVVYRILLAAVTQMPQSLVAYIGSMVDEETWPTGYVFKAFAGARSPYKGNNVTYLDELENSNVSRETQVPSSNTYKNGNEDTTEDAITTKRTFSVYAMRKERVLSLPTRKARSDADDLVGKLVFPSTEEVEEAFGENGVLAAIYPDYEMRNEQRDMALAIRDSLEHGENLVVEAGTGVGKSMAYLVPMVQFARKNGVGVGVATKTNSLLDQLVYHELPLLCEAMEKADAPAGIAENRPPLAWAPLKGMTHYPCLRRISHMVDDGPGTREVVGKSVTQAPHLAAVLSYVEQSDYDDIDSLKIDFRALPRYQITTTSTECLRRKCPFFGRLCFVHGARRRAETADVVVTNHTLLFCDIAADGGLLPTIRHWVVDEAHSTEAEARSAFAETVDCEALTRIAVRVNDSSGARNVFERAQRGIAKIDAEQLTLFFGLVAKARSAGNSFAKAAEEYQRRVKDLLFFDPVKRTRRGQSYEQVDVWINAEVRSSEVFADVASSASGLVDTADKLIKASSELVAYMEGVDEAVVAQREIAACAMELRDIRNAAELIFVVAPESYAYQATLNRKKDRHNDKVQALLLDVGDKLNDTFYARTHDVVYASATLTVGSSFDSFESSVGLNHGEFSQARELQLDSSYDFDNNMIVYVPSDMPEPTDPDYAEALNRLLVKAHSAQKGSMLTLFTNRREMERSFAEVSPVLKSEGLRLVCQKYGLSVKGLRDEFLADEHLSLFALKSFWEGFDAPGATLKGVIIPKLPFGRPTDPLYCERAARDDRAWWRYVLPQAVLETKQAAGRLIRKADDRGVLILADKRLLTKSYGKTFLGSLQSKTVRVCTIDEIISALHVLGSW